VSLAAPRIRFDVVSSGEALLEALLLPAGALIFSLPLLLPSLAKIRDPLHFWMNLAVALGIVSLVAFALLSPRRSFRQEDLSRDLADSYHPQGVRWLRRLLLGVMVLGLLLLAVVGVGRIPQALLQAYAVFVGTGLIGGLVVRKHLDVSYFLDRPKRHLEYRRSLGWLRWTRPVCGFETVQAVLPWPHIEEMSAEGGPELSYPVYLFPRTGPPIQISDRLVDLEEANRVARQAAVVLGVPVLEVAPDEALIAHGKAGRIEIERVPVKLLRPTEYQDFPPAPRFGTPLAIHGLQAPMLTREEEVSLLMENQEVR
jgi:hypothetical protein